MAEPNYVNLELPADTIALTATGATFILTASGDGQLVPQLAINSKELGWYQVFLNRAVFVSLLGQLDYLKHLTDADLTVITTRLHTTEGNQP